MSKIDEKLKKIKTKLTEEEMNSLKNEIAQSESILKNLNATFHGLIYRDTLKSIRDVNDMATEEAVDLIAEQYIDFLEEHNTIPPIDPNIFIDIVAGIHLNTLKGIFTDTVIDAFAENFVKTTADAIKETIYESQENSVTEETPESQEGEIDE